MKNKQLNCLISIDLIHLDWKKIIQLDVELV